MTAGRVAVYYVDPQEDLSDVLEALRRAPNQRLAVVLPDSTAFSCNAANLRLLSETAEKAGQELALISGDDAVVRVAEAIGLAVFCSVDLAWQPEGRLISTQITAPIPTIDSSALSEIAATGARFWPAQRMLAVAIALIAIIILALSFTPRVTVVVTPASRVLERSFVVPFDHQGEAGAIPLRAMEMDVEVSLSAPATGRRQEGVAAATGTVMLFNETDRALEVPAGTVVATAGDQSFKITGTVRVPSRQAEYFMEVPVGIKAGKAEARVKAEKAGSAGNVAAGRINSLPKGPTGLRVVNPEPTRGGTDRSVSYVTNADLTNLRSRLSAQLEQEAEAQMGQGVGDGAYLVASLTEITETKFVTKSKAGEEAESLQATLHGKASGRYVLLTDLQRFVENEVNQSAPTGYLVRALPAVSIEAEDGKQGLRVAARISLGGMVDPVAISQLVAGRSPAEARRLLLESGEVGEMEIVGRARKRLPSWTPWIRVVVADSDEATGVSDT